MFQNRIQRSQGMVWPLAITLAFFLFYLYTLAPTVLWGDDAYFQRVALTGELRADGGGHWLWLQLAQLFARFPWGDVAFRSNLLSAVAASGTLLFLYFSARQAGLRRDAATVAVVSLGIGHTFWMHAVRAEVYTLFTLFVAFHFLLWARWTALSHDTCLGQRKCALPFYTGAALLGPTLLAHQMGLFLILPWTLLVWWRRNRLSRVQLIIGAALFLAGFIPFLGVIHMQIVKTTGATIVEAIHLYFTHSGADFGPSLFAVSLPTLPRALLMAATLTALQFSSPALLLIPMGVSAALRSRRHELWKTLLIFYALDVVFAATYDVNDRYVFLLPGYLALALFAGAGWQAARAMLEAQRRKREQWESQRAIAALLVLLVVVPLCFYYAAPRALVAAGANPMRARSLPEREPNEFFLWPGKRAYYGAEQYGEKTLSEVPWGAVVIADHTPVQTLKYLQEIRGMRGDVRLLAIEPGDDLGSIIARLPQDTPIYLADRNPEYYNLRSVPEVTLAESGPVYRLDLPLN